MKKTKTTRWSKGLGWWKKDPDDFKDSSFNFPVVLLDVDGTLPKFRSAVEIDDDDSVDQNNER